jgi:V8-like Glu-specific endopeptidase
MALTLTAEQERDLRDAIVEAFSPGDLPIVVRDHVKDELHNLVAPGTHVQQVFSLIGACRQRGWLGRLVFGVAAERGQHPRVLDLARRLGLHPGGAPGGVERLVGANIALVDLQPWLHRCSVVAAQVCQVRVDGEKRGTGFLVGPDAVLTNHHVVSDALDRPGAVAFVFDYARAATGEVHAGVTYAGKELLACSPLGPDGQWDAPASAQPGDDELDFALIALTERAGARGLGAASEGRPRGWLAVPSTRHDFATTAGLAILQHPLGDPVKLALDFAERGKLTSSAGRRVRYTIPTQPGSSGAPVLDARSWSLVALHHGGDPTIRGAPSYNQGIPIAAIAAHPVVQPYLATVPTQ